MITLKIKQPGLTIAIPGLNVYRTPVEIDVSKIDIRVVIMYLKTSGIKKYEIVAKNNEDVEVYTNKDFDVEDQQLLKKYKQKKIETKKESTEISSKIKNYDDRFNKLEGMIMQLISAKSSNPTTNSEQIINKIQELENKLSKMRVTTTSSEKISIDDDPVIEELETFIPSIDTSDMKMSSSNNVKKIKQENSNVEDNADLLSSLLKKNGGKS